MITTVMIVDDDKDDRELFAEALRDVFPESVIIKATGGEEALALLEEKAPDIIFLDLNMPILNGFETLTAIRSFEQHAMLPVVIYSTSNRADEKEKSLSLGANMFITKPHYMKGIREAITIGMELLNKKASGEQGNPSSHFKHLQGEGDR